MLDGVYSSGDSGIRTCNGARFLLPNTKQVQKYKYISKDIHSASVSVALWIGRQTPKGGVLGSRPRQGGLFFQSVQ